VINTIMSFKAEYNGQNDKNLFHPCPFAADCIFKDIGSCNMSEFPDFFNCTDYLAKRKKLFVD